MAAYSGVLKWWYPLPYEAAGTIRFKEDGQSATTVDPFGTIADDDVLIAATGSSFTWGDWTVRPILGEVAAALSGAYGTANTYAFQAFNAASFADDTGAKLVRTAGSDGFQIEWSHAGTTIDPRLLGWSASPPSQSFDLSGEIEPPYSYLGAAHIEADSPPLRDLRHGGDRLRCQSDIDPRFGYANEWETTPSYRAHQKLRRLELFDVPAARVLPDRATMAAEASRAGIVTDDQNAQLLPAWRWATLGPSWLNPVWPTRSDRLVIDGDTPAEPVQWASRPQLRQFRRVARDLEDADQESYVVSALLYVGDTATIDH